MELNQNSIRRDITASNDCILYRLKAVSNDLEIKKCFIGIQQHENIKINVACNTRNMLL